MKFESKIVINKIVNIRVFMITNKVNIMINVIITMVKSPIFVINNMVNIRLFMITDRVNTMINVVLSA